MSLTVRNHPAIREAVLRRVSLISGLLMALASSGQAAAGSPIVPTSQTRSIDATAYAVDDFSGPFNDSQTDQALDFSPFVSAISANANADSAIGSGGGQQDSSILSDRLLAVGSLFSNAETWDFGASADASAVNLFRVNFELASDVSYTLQGEIEAFDNAISEISLRKDGVETFGAIAFGPATTLPIDESGTLTAGDYTLELRVEGSVFGFEFDPDYSSGSYDVAFQVMASSSPGGEVPDGDDIPGAQPLIVDRLPGGDVRLSWSSSCRPADNDFIVYEGRLGDPASLSPVICSTGGLNAWDLSPGHAAAFYLVVPTDGNSEGSYGDTSGNSQRTPAAAGCRPQVLGAPVCP